MKVPKKDTDDGPTAAKQPRLSAEAPSGGDKKQETETVTVRKQCQFERLKTTLNVDWSVLTAKQLKKITTAYFVIRTLLDYCTETGGDKPDLTQQEQIRTQCEKTMSNLKLDGNLLSDKFTLR